MYYYTYLSLSTRGSIYCQTESPPSNYYIGGSTCMTSMYRVPTYDIAVSPVNVLKIVHINH